MSFTEIILNEYPGIVCFECGQKHGRHVAGVCSAYKGICGVCGEEKTCTEPRDFGHLNVKIRKSRKGDPDADVQQL